MPSTGLRYKDFSGTHIAGNGKSVMPKQETISLPIAVLEALKQATEPMGSSQTPLAFHNHSHHSEHLAEAWLALREEENTTLLTICRAVDDPNLYYIPEIPPIQRRNEGDNFRPLAERSLGIVFTVYRQGRDAAEKTPYPLTEEFHLADGVISWKPPKGNRVFRAFDFVLRRNHENNNEHHFVCCGTA